MKTIDLISLPGAIELAPPDPLSGWSVARLGPIYFLASASDSQKAQIHKIVLFNPGSEANMSGCDQRYDGAHSCSQ